MPHFTLQVTGSGPVLTAWVGVSAARHAALVAAGQSTPPLVMVTALVDTGASCTCLDPSVFDRLQLTPTGFCPINTPSTGATPHSTAQYDVALAIPGANPTDTPLAIQTIPVVAADLSIQGIDGLIGRDILGRCLLVYNGKTGLFTLGF